MLLREAWRGNGKVCKRTVANLSDWPMDKIEALRAVLRSEGGIEVVPTGEAPMDVVRSLPCGHVAAMRRLNMEEVVGLDGPVGKRVQAMIAARILDPQSKLATAQGLGGESGWLQALSQDVGVATGGRPCGHRGPVVSRSNGGAWSPKRRTSSRRPPSTWKLSLPMG